MELEFEKKLVMVPAMHKKDGLDHDSFLVSAVFLQTSIKEISFLTKLDSRLVMGDLVQYEADWYKVISLSFGKDGIIYKGKLFK